MTSYYSVFSCSVNMVGVVDYSDAIQVKNTDAVLIFGRNFKRALKVANKTNSFFYDTPYALVKCTAEEYNELLGRDDKFIH